MLGLQDHRALYDWSCVLSKRKGFDAQKQLEYPERGMQGSVFARATGR